MDNTVIDISKVPQLQFQINNDELKNCLKQLYYQNKLQQKNLNKLKKEIENKTNEEDLFQILAIISSNIQIEENDIICKQNSQFKMKTSAEKLGNKIQQLVEKIVNLSSKVNSVEHSINTSIQRLKQQIKKDNFSFEQQIKEIRISEGKQNIEQQRRTDSIKSQFDDKIRQIETKTLWKIKDCEIKLQNRVNQQMVKDSMKQCQGRILTQVKLDQIKRSDPPIRLDAMQNRIIKNEKDTNSSITSIITNLRNLEEHLNSSMLSKKQFNTYKQEFDKNINNINSNIGQCFHNFTNNEKQFKQLREKILKVTTMTNDHLLEINKMHTILVNLKLSDDFQKLIQTLDPHSICQLQSGLQNQRNKQQTIQKQLKQALIQMQSIRSKTQFCCLMGKDSNTKGDEINKEQIIKIVSDYCLENQFNRKIQVLEQQIVESKSSTGLINEMNKRIIQIQKETDRHSIIYELKGLQQYVKKQILIVTNRINSFEKTLMDEKKKKRPLSDYKNNTNHGNLGSTVSFKKLIPMSCISCYPNNNGNHLGVEKKLLGNNY